MADMLKFRKGTLAQINGANKVAGTIYIAKDEKAMYVDVDNSTRIRIGDFVRVATVNDIPFPASTTALYYVEADNALLGYDGENWKQINGTKDLADRLETVEDLAATNASDIATLKSNVSQAQTDIQTNAADIEDIKAAIGMGEDGEVEGLNGRVTSLEEAVEAIEGSIETIESDIEALEGTVGTHTTDIGNLNTAVGTKAEKSYVDETFAKKSDVYAKTETFTQAEVNAAIKVETDRAKLAEEANASAAQAAATAAQEAKDIANGKIDLAGVQALNYATKTKVEEDITAAINGEVTRADNKYATKTQLEATDEVVTSHTTKIGEIEDALDERVTKTELEGKGYATTGQVATAKQEAINAAATAAAGIYAKQTDLNATNEAVGTAQSRADDAYDLAETKITEAEVETLIAGKGYATTGQVATAKQEAIDAAKTAGDLAYAAKSIEETVAGHTTSIGTLTTAVGNAQSAAEAAQKTIDDFKTEHASDYTNAQIDAAIKVAKDAADAAQEDADANAGKIATIEGQISTINGEGEGSIKKAVADAKAELSAEIDADIRAANAMEFVKGVSSADQLPSTAKNGATYVVESAFGGYLPGDMLIAQGTEDPDTGLITNPTWAHVQTGYDASLDQKLTGADNQIKLSTGAGTEGTAVSFAATGSASVEVANNTVTIGIVWDDFPAQA